MPARCRLALQNLVDLLPAALLAALVVVSTFGVGQSIVIDARVAGMVVAGAGAVAARAVRVRDHPRLGHHRARPPDQLNRLTRWSGADVDVAQARVRLAPQWLIEPTRW